VVGPTALICAGWCELSYARPVFEMVLGCAGL
jgi:hypothetical protein